MKDLEDQLQRFDGKSGIVFWSIALGLSLIGLFLSLIVIVKILRFWLIRASQARKGRNCASRMPQAALDLETIMGRLSMFMALIDSGVSAIRIFLTLFYGPGGAQTKRGVIVMHILYNAPWFQALLHVYFSVSTGRPDFPSSRPPLLKAHQSPLTHVSALVFHPAVGDIQLGDAILFLKQYNQGL